MKKVTVFLMLISLFCCTLLSACSETDEERDQRLIMEEIKKRSR